MRMYFRGIKKLISALMAVILLLLAVPAALAESFSAYVHAAAMPVYADAALTRQAGTLGQFTVFTVTEYTGNAAKLQYNGMSLYASTADMTPVEAVAIKAVVNKEARVYQQPTLSSVSVRLAKGEEVNVIAVRGDWALIEKSGVGGYTAASVLTPVPTVQPEATPAPTAVPGNQVFTETFSAQVATDNLVVYKDASETNPMGTLPKGLKVTVTAYTSEWARIEINGITGYVRLSGVTRVAAATATPAPTAATGQEDLFLLMANAKPAVITVNTRVYQSPTLSSASVHAPADMKVNLLAVNGQWAMVESNGVVAYMNAAHVQIVTATATPAPTAAPIVTPTPTQAPVQEDLFQLMANAEPAVITTKTKVYQSPSLSSLSVNVSAGMKVNLLAINTPWAMVESNGVVAYMNAAHVTPLADMATPAPTVAPTPAVDYSEIIGTSGTVIVTADTKVYQYASLTSASIAVPKGMKLNLLGVNGQWAMVENGGVVAYMDAAYLSRVTTPSPTATPGSDYGDLMANAQPAVITVNTRVYQSASTSAASVSVSAGMKVNLLSISGQWAMVENNGVIAYMNAAHLTVAAATATPAPADPTAGFVRETFDATVVSSGAKLCASADAASAIRTLSLGTNVTVAAYNAEWAYVDASGTKGFVLVSALSRTNYTALGKGSTGSSVTTLEKALLGLGYLDAEPDTAYSSETVSAVQLFQTACGLASTGTADQTTQRVLFSSGAPASSMLSNSYAKGSKGGDVQRIQNRLLSLGYLSKSGSVDGDYGTTTHNAVKLFQTHNGLTATGTADSTTLKKMYSTSAESLPSGKTPADVSVVINPVAGNQQNNSTQISTTLASTTSTYSKTMSGAEKLEYVIYVAQNQLGKPYIYGANGPSSYDCTGFTCYAFKQIGISLPRTAVNQGYSETYPKITSISELKRGDLVYLNTVNDGDLSDHAGIYLGAGYFIHASSGQAKVVISSLATGYYNGVFSWGRRVFD